MHRSSNAQFTYAFRNSGETRPDNFDLCGPFLVPGNRPVRACGSGAALEMLFTFAFGDDEMLLDGFGAISPGVWLDADGSDAIASKTDFTPLPNSLSSAISIWR